MYASTTDQTDSIADLIRSNLHKLFDVGDLVEIRALNCGRESTIRGYYDDFVKAADDAAALENREIAGGIYFTINRPSADHLSLSANRLERNAKKTTTDAGIVRRRYLPIDIDPCRLAGIPSNAAELREAFDRARRIFSELLVFGWPEPIVASSGNGMHLLYHVDEPNNELTNTLFQRALAGLQSRFGDSVVAVDTKVFNAARIIKLYGTTARKGSSLPERPHRRSGILQVPRKREFVTIDMLRAIAPEPKVASNPNSRTTIPIYRHSDGVDIEKFIVKHGLTITKREQDKLGAERLILDVCPFDSSHDGPRDATILRYPSGGLHFHCFHHSCAGRKWADLREMFEPTGQQNRTAITDTTSGADDAGGVDRGTVSNGSTFSSVKNDEWADLRPLAEVENPVDYDLRIIPEAFRAYIADEAERACVPIGFIAIPMMVAFGSVVGRQLAICPKAKNTGWYEIPNNWGMVVASPGAMKSSSQDAGLAGITWLDRAAGEEYRMARDAYASVYDAAELDIRRIETLLKKPNSADRFRLESELRDAKRVLTEAPKRRLFTVQDCTHEKIALDLVHNPNGILQVRDELAGFLANLEKPGRDDARAFWIECWAGKNPHKVRRVSDRSGNPDGIDLPAACAAVLGTIQPGPVRKLVADAAGLTKGADGFFQRFQLVFVQAELPLWQDADRDPDIPAYNRMLTIFKKSVKLDTVALGAKSGRVPFLQFDPEAQKCFDEWQGELMNRTRSSTEAASFVAYLAKMKKTVPTLALLFHLAEVLESGESSPISSDSLSMACAWGEVLEQHAKWIYNLEPPAASHTMAKLIHNGSIVDGMTMRNLRRKCWSGLSTPSEISLAIEGLEDAGWLRIERSAPGPRGGQPAEMIRLHPALREA